MIDTTHATSQTQTPTPKVETEGRKLALLRKLGRAISEVAPGAADEINTLRNMGRKLTSDDPRVRREAAAKLASQLFFQPLLAELRKTPFGEKLGRGGRTEEVFGEQLDTRVADTVAFSDPGGLTTQLESTIDPQKAAKAGEAARGVSWQTALQAKHTEAHS